ncbi:aminoacyl-histidine dipeptidase [Melioribacter roseus P3M-2]|uniref:Cytosol non-specific dipeptidase n=1 Tax=Melioribacter roseus (strain DSM 23840 / JCM 17771 / VKM B-2668 / P3M-2) TaxID=1191523 RepID=I7A2P7_MELRP|nr:aminoacyl-histidine dipeptidase [Melioribacter roseus]AFN75458.1 aminoacyl-histidine dipeptidase [Melioribacter roseus P3M-2]
MSNTLGNLKPELLWKHFEEICMRPHPSRNEKLVSEYIIDFAKKNSLDYSVDGFGNIVVRKPATPGKENLMTVAFQGHLDMVPEKNNDVKHNFDKDPIQAYVDGDWVKAKGTTLGSDNGIGVAAALAILESKDLEHGPIEALFTLDEETGLNGAQALQPGFLKADIMINLDSEEDGAFYIGCAGGQNTFAEFKIKTTPYKENTVPLEVSITGLKGGHSGLDIASGRGNAIKLMARLLYNLNEKFGVTLSKINGGSKHNAIPREAFALIRIPKKNYLEVLDTVSKFESAIQAELATVEPSLQVIAKKVQSRAKVIDKATSDKIIASLFGIQNGVIKMSADIEGLVETSSNLAVVVTKQNSVEVITSQRSSVESEKYEISNAIAAVFKLAKAKVNFGEGYPGWKPDINSPILKIMKGVYKHMFGAEPEIKAIHAGLECGIIKEKFPHIDMISLGPTIQGAHSPDEKVQISTVQKFWDILVNTLKAIPSK